MPSQESVYVNGQFSEPMSAQHNFSEQYDLEDPATAMSSYNRVMHQHTKQQLATATNSAARRRTTSNGKTGSISSESSVGSLT
ncbi:hypothetical protein K402DRAFT_332147 [Aulographum hederae CBS 113979]|uniref:Uncharacterized protein n=1 Tax=Aulographum hederae CBS 113979 TaxID=1176131 RepID=A0A6G1H0L3_9PEZI|nr:hypothetical protein K402DRAFT_332147 [Aulographum hederae CBS 113979]